MTKKDPAAQNISQGYVCLHRDIRDHWIWQNPIECRWWLDLIMEANYSEKRVSLGNQVITCKRGQSVKSLETWAKRWRVDKNKVRRFFEKLESDGMVVRESVQKTTRLTICNYDSYNQSGNDNETKVNRRRNGSESEVTPNNKDNKDNKDKREGGTPPSPPPAFKRKKEKLYTQQEKDSFRRFQEWIDENAKSVSQLQEPFNIDQYLKIAAAHPTSFITDLLQSMHNKKDLLKQYKSAYLTFISWAKIRKKKEIKPVSQNPVQPELSIYSQGIKEEALGTGIQ